MPAKSKSQQQLFGMALAVRRGELPKSKVGEEVLDIVNSKMSDKDIEDFASTPHKGLSKYVKESLMDSENFYFVIIKPGFLHLAQEILKIYKDKGFDLLRIRTTKLNPTFARRLYQVHKKEKFYKDLCNYMSSGLSMGIELNLGNHKPDEKTLKELLSIKDEIRKKWGESDMRNVIHSSDSWENVKKECINYF